VNRWQQDSFSSVSGLLGDEAQLLRFDAFSALMLEGGDEGRKLALAHAARETNPVLKQLIESSKRGGKSAP
jgi:hypothetical protein